MQVLGESLSVEQGPGQVHPDDGLAEDRLREADLPAPTLPTSWMVGSQLARFALMRCPTSATRSSASRISGVFTFRSSGVPSFARREIRKLSLEWNDVVRGAG